MILDELPVLQEEPRIIYTGLMNYENYRKMLQRSNLHCYLTRPYVTSWSLFEAVSCGTPIITNESPATTGTIDNLSQETIIKHIDDIYKPKGIELIIKMIATNKPRTHNLSQKYTINSAMSNWQALINRCLTQA